MTSIGRLARRLRARGASRDDDAPGALTVVTSTYPPHLGGLEEVARETAQVLARRRPVRVLTTDADAGDAPRRDTEGEVEVRRHRSRVIANTAVAPGLLVRLFALPRDTVAYVHVASLLVPEVTALAARLRGYRTVMHFHLDVAPTGPLGRILEPYKTLAVGPALRHADRVVVLSDEQRRFVARRYAVAWDRIRVVPNGVSVRRLEPEAPWRDPWPDAPDGLRVLFVGRLATQKRVERLVEAVSRATTPVTVAVVGEGDQRPQIEDAIRRCGVDGRVRLVGARQGRELGDWYRWADAFTLTSDQEGLSIAMLEAMAMGLPIVATDVPGLREHVGEAGVLGAPDPDGVARALDRMGDPAVRARCARASRAEGQRASWETRIAPLRDAIDEASR